MRVPAFAFGKNRFNRKWRLLPAMLFVCVALGLTGQPTHADDLLTQNFDADPVNYTNSGFFVQNPATGPNLGTRYFNLSNAANINLNPGITGADGVYVTVQDADIASPAYTTDNPPTLTFNSVQVLNHGSLNLSLNLAGLPNAETANYLRAQIDLTGNGTWTNVFNFVGNNNSPYTNGAETLAGAFANFNYPIPTPNDGVLRLRVQTFNETDNLNEATAYDSILVTGTANATADFGAVAGPVALHFSEPAAGSISYVRGTNPPGTEPSFTTLGGTPQGVTDVSGNNQFLVNNATANFRSELIDLRGVGLAKAEIDLRSYDLSSGFEVADFLRAYVDVSTDGITFTRMNFFSANGVDGDNNDPLDALEMAGNGGPNGAFRHFTLTIPENVETLRFGVDAFNNSGNEFFAFDNLTVQAATPTFGDVIPNAKTNFNEPNVAAIDYVRGTNAPGTELGFSTITTAGAPQGVTDFGGDKQFQVSNSGVTFTSDLIDLRSVGGLTAKIDLRTYDLTTGFEANDFLRAFVEVSTDGITFTRMSFFDAFGVDGDNNDPLDLLETGGGATGPFSNFTLSIGSEISALRFGVEALNNSTNEFMLFDNLLLLLAQFPGDADGSGTVDFTDLGILLNNYNQAGAFETGDFDGSGTVDFTDLGILLNNYNQPAPTNSQAAAVPEPSTLLLGCAGVLGVLIAARRKR